MFVNTIAFDLNRCISGVHIKEYQTFQLESSALRSFVSKERDDDILVGGVKNSKNFQQLEMCIVSTNGECNPPFPTSCIYENVQYRIKVNGPQKGYLRVEGDQIRIVEHFHDASELNLNKESGSGLRIEHMHNGRRLVFATTKAGQPLTLETPNRNDERQWFELLSDRDREIECKCSAYSFPYCMLFSSYLRKY